MNKSLLCRYYNLLYPENAIDSTDKLPAHFYEINKYIPEYALLRVVVIVEKKRNPRLTAGILSRQLGYHPDRIRSIIQRSK